MSAGTFDQGGGVLTTTLFPSGVPAPSASKEALQQGFWVSRKSRQISGEVALKGQLVVAAGAEITADVEARSVLVEGSVEGDVSASDDISVSASARVTGTLRGSNISVEEGATLSGRIEADFELPPELSGKASR